MRKFTLLLLVLSSISASAQNFSWLQSPSVDNDINNSESSYPVTTDAFGNSYLAGFKDMPFNYSELLGRVQYNKYNNNGDLLYSKLISGRVVVNDIKTDSDGNLIMIAGFNQSIGFENFSLLTTNQGMKYILIKFDPQGTLLWHVLIDPDDETFINDMDALTLDNSNNIYVGYGDFMDSWITKYSPQGNTLFTIEQSHVNRVTSLSIDNAGNIYAAGSCADGDATYAQVSVPTTFDYNTYVVKYSPTGVFQWVRYVDDITCSRPHVRAFTSDAVYFASYLYGNYTFDSIQTEGPNQNMDDFFLAKLNSNGNFQWVREVPGTGRITIGHRNFLDLDTSGNIYLTGSTAGPINWGNGFSTATVGFSNYNGLLLKYDPQGTMQLVKTIANPGHDILNGISVNGNGEMFVSGLMGFGTATFDNLQISVPQYDYYPVLAKITPVTLGTSENEIQKPKLYPNPSSDFIMISGIPSAKGTIINAVGQKIIDINVDNNSPVNISQLAKGAYIIRLDGHTPMKFIKS